MNVINDFLTINFTSGGLKEIRGLLMHSMWGTYAGSVAWFKNPDAKASAHYCISKEGEIRHMVDESKGDMAWHGGYVDVPPCPSWVLPNPNNYTIGIELEDLRDPNWQYPEAQRKAASELVNELCKRYGFGRDRCLMHKETNPSRRSDPVGQFSWDWVFPNEEPVTTDEQNALKALKEFKATSQDFQSGNLEGTIRGLIGSYTDHKKCPEQLTNQRNELTDAFAKERSMLIKTNETEITKLNQDWQTKLESAKSELEKCKTDCLSAYSVSQLFSIAWKKWWASKK